MMTTRRSHLFLDDEGAVTVEYAMLFFLVGALIGTVYLVVTSDWFQDLVSDLIRDAMQEP
ncbi:DUF4244 domain-containing protein [Kibdelosporangium persicum]|uniref:DUF4244 domain-containing protein n=2 Tax=Kibdelosporangium persicum TaxID=2698649 RepID=A0ABX2F5R9_9PSEU|nr:hypothetical protein [Kibdelosporangium persicum]